MAILLFLSFFDEQMEFGILVQENQRDIALWFIYFPGGQFCYKTYVLLLPSYILYILEGSAPYGAQTSSSCGGLVAFCHQMGALWAPLLVKLKFGVIHDPPSSSFGWLEAFSHLIGALLVYGFVFFCFIHHWTPTESFPESFVKI